MISAILFISFFIFLILGVPIGIDVYKRQFFLSVLSLVPVILRQGSAGTDHFPHRGSPMDLSSHPGHNLPVV